MQFDVLVLGGGLAGLRAAEAASEAGCSVAVVSRGAGASPGIIGFNAPVEPPDTPEIFAEDTLKNGAGESSPELVQQLANDSSQSVYELENKYKIAFRKENGHYHRMKPLGCSFPRLVHAANKTGTECISFLEKKLSSSGTVFLNVAGIAELSTLEDAVCGAAVFFPDGSFRSISAKAVVLACGGGGSLYAGSTYPATVNGTGYALARNAGAGLTGMEFVQFEPCRCIFPYPMGISTTLLAHGGCLLNGMKRKFFEKPPGAYGKAELAYLIAREIAAGRGSLHGGVLLDLTAVPVREITIDHEMYYNRFLAAGINLTRTPVEVAPAAHTFLGGVRINSSCETSVPGLFAAGEVTGGIHGANRIGGNAGTEVLVFGKIAGESAAAFAKHNPLKVKKFSPVMPMYSVKSVRPRIGNILSSLCGVLRTTDGLKKAQEDLLSLKLESYDDHHAAESAMAVVSAALSRPESLGVHHIIKDETR